MAAQPSVEAPKGETKACCGCKKAKMMKPSELPLYGNPYPPKDLIQLDEAGMLETGFKTTREAVTPYVDMASGAIDQVKRIYYTGVAHTRQTYDRISTDGNSVDKAVAITAGGLVGMLISARKGFFKKILYTATGVGIMTAACYPKQTTELAEVSTYIARKKGPEILKQYSGLDISQYLEEPKVTTKAIDEKDKKDN
ncbi:hypothetical protein HDE_03235 [Halotydeus destructor]|nr:hypothetical protein HDE_03235 [Halotydeus destructor]